MCRINYPVPIHHASTRPLGTKETSCFKSRNARNLYELKIKGKVYRNIAEKDGTK